MRLFSETLRRLRHERHLTQYDMAKALNISRVAYTNYELGNREPDFNTMLSIANILNTTVDYLLGSSNNKDKVDYSDTTLAIPYKYEHMIKDIMTLSPESLEDLRKYLELLKIREKAKLTEDEDKKRTKKGNSKL